MKKIYFVIIFVLFFSGKSIFSHPHVFIENSAIFILNNDSVKGIQVTWIFDDIFSSSIINDYDKDKNYIFNENESLKIYDDAFSNLENYNYFCYIKINNKEVNFKKVKNFSASILNKKKLVYSFFIPINKKITNSKTNISLLVYDKSNFCNVDTKDKNSISIKGVSLKNSLIYLKKKTIDEYYSIKEIVCSYTK